MSGLTMNAVSNQPYSPCVRASQKYSEWLRPS
jgi:hypothetical protein